DPWEEVRDMYRNRNNSAKIFQIQQDIANIHQDDKPCVKIYRPLTIDPVILRKRIEDDRVFQLLASLILNFEDFRSHILMNAELPSLKSVCATIQREDIRRKVMSRDPTSNALEVRAYLARPSSEKWIYTLDIGAEDMKSHSHEF
ncbi:hypothetical protein MIMGU_mgv1a020438mg, partial [Erythranthe guttata]